jgi:hypothetical protein
MYAKLLFSAVVAGLLLSVSSLSLAQGKACLMEATFAIGTEKLEIKDCLQNEGVAQARFVQTCTSLAEAASGKVTYMAACPSQPQGSCATTLLGGPTTSYYYKRDANTLAISKSSCLAQGGKWK